MNSKLVSIIIPVYNAEKYLKETLDSVITQTYKNWECIIVDDGSTDYSKNIALDFCRNDNRFNYYCQKNSGPSVARNYGVSNARGDYIQYLDADDVLLPERLEMMIEKSANVGDNVILYSNVLHGHDNIYNTSSFSRPTSIGCDITFNDMYRKFLLDFIFPPTCVFFPRESVSRIKWNEKLNHSEDWDYYLSILKNQ